MLLYFEEEISSFEGYAFQKDCGNFTVYKIQKFISLV